MEEGGEEGMKRRGGGLLVLQREYGGCRSSATGDFFLGIPDRPGLVSCSLAPLLEPSNAAARGTRPRELPQTTPSAAAPRIGV